MSYLAKYELLGRIAASTNDEVYRAVCKHSGKIVALTVFRSAAEFDYEFWEMTRRFTRMQSRIDCPIVAKVFEERLNEVPAYLATELLEGKPLDSLIRDSGSIPIELAVKITKDVAKAMTLAHQHEVFFQSLELSDIIVSANSLARISRFGVGSPASLQPQRIDSSTPLAGVGRVATCTDQKLSQIRQDVYVLGSLLFEMITGVSVIQDHSTFNTPIDDPTIAMQRQDIIGFADLPISLKQVVYTATSDNPSDRFSSCEAFMDSLIFAVAQTKRNFARKKRISDGLASIGTFFESWISSPKCWKWISVGVAVAIVYLALLKWNRYWDADLGRQESSIPGEVKNGEGPDQVDPDEGGSGDIDNHPAIADCYRGVGSACLELGNFSYTLGKIGHARYYYEIACRRDEKDACNRLGAIEDQAGNKEVAVNWEKRACALGRTVSCTVWGYLLEDLGRVDRALDAYQIACAGGHMIACNNIGAIEAAAGRKSAASAYFKSACQGGYSKACARI